MAKEKRIVAVGCSHGALIDSQTSKEVLAFCDRFQPHYRIHLGDFIDLASLRSGASGSPDSLRSTAPDLLAAFEFLEEFRPTHLFFGNHEDRLYNASAKMGVLGDLAGRIFSDIFAFRDKTKCRLIEKYNVRRSNTWVDIGNARFMHGFMYNEAATRDHAEAFAPVGGTLVHAHTHRADLSRGRRHDTPLGLCVGTLANVPEMDYAARRKQTLAWSHGAVFGYTNEKETRLWLSDAGQNPLTFPL